MYVAILLTRLMFRLPHDKRKTLSKDVTDKTESFTFNFGLFGSMSALLLLLTWAFVPSERGLGKDVIECEIKSSCHHVEEEGDDEDNQTNNAKEIAQLLLRPFYLAFLIELIVLGAAVGTVERLLFVYVQNDLDGSTTLCGLSVGVNVRLASDQRSCIVT